ncbi:MAG: DoxX-like family protein [Cyclobacteriaceae bacterium]
MKSQTALHKLLYMIIALVWLINGLLCKVLDLVPRHERIVAEILSVEYSRPLTVLIGISEIVMALWVISRFRSGLSASLQMALVLTMNILEIILVPKLLLWGRLNIIFALAFILIVYYNEFILGKRLKDN